MEDIGLGSLIIAGVATLFTIIAWISSKRAKREESRQQREHEEVEAFVRAQTIYTTTIETQRVQLQQSDERIKHLTEQVRELEQS